MEVSSPPGSVIGSVELPPNRFWMVKFAAKDPEGNVVLKIEEPPAGHEFRVFSPNGAEVGVIKKQWDRSQVAGFEKNKWLFVSFPVNMDVKTKATLLGAAFLIDTFVPIRHGSYYYPGPLSHHHRRRFYYR